MWQTKCILSFLVHTVFILNRSLSMADLFIPNILKGPPELSRANNNKILTFAQCEKFCEFLTWEIKSPQDRNWRSADFKIHSKSYPNYFYIRGLNADTNYTVRALVRPRNGGLPYAAEDVPTLEVRTCPGTPPAVSDLRFHSAGPRETEIRWKEKIEFCKSDLFYEVRYATYSEDFSEWRSYGKNESGGRVEFRPMHPCSVWPEEFCLLLAVGVNPGEQAIVQVRVIRYDEDPKVWSLTRNVIVQADADRVVNIGCPTLDVLTTTSTSLATTVATTAPPLLTESMNPDDSYISTTEQMANESDMSLPTEGYSTQSPPTLRTPVTYAHDDGTSLEMCDGGSSVCRLSPVFWTLLIFTFCMIPAAFLLGRRYRRRGTHELQMVSVREQLCGGDEDLPADDIVTK